MADDSNSSDVASRYARALFDLAEDAGSTAVVEKDLASLKAAWADSADLRAVLRSPTYSAEQKAAVLAAVAKAAKLNALTVKFLGLLAANRRAGALTAVIAAFQTLSANARDVVAAEVTTASPLTAAQAKGVQAALRQALGKDPEITTRVDPEILGGMKVRVGSRLYDASLRSKLDQMKFALKRA